jgi:hypothetical protein
MLYREIIAVCSEIHTKHINTLCGQTVEFFNIKPGKLSLGFKRLNGNAKAVRLRFGVVTVYLRIACFWDLTVHELIVASRRF